MEAKDISMGATAMIIANQGSRIKQLEQQLKEAVKRNEKLIEALEFYDGAHRKNWCIDLNKLATVANDTLKEINKTNE